MVSLKTINIIQNLSRNVAIRINPDRLFSIVARFMKLEVRQVNGCQVGQDVHIGWRKPIAL